MFYLLVHKYEYDELHFELFSDKEFAELFAEQIKKCNYPTAKTYKEIGLTTDYKCEIYIKELKINN